MNRKWIASSALCLATLAPVAQAHWIVLDPDNLVQNVLQALRDLEQINNQIKQIQNQAQMLSNQARNLTSLDFNALNQLRAALSATNQLIQQAQGLAFNVSQMEAAFTRLYPTSYSSAITGLQMSTDARQRWQNALEALRTATKVQSQAVQNFASDEQTLTDLVTAASRRSVRCKRCRRRINCWRSSRARRCKANSFASRRTVPQLWSRRARSRCRSVRAKSADASRVMARPTPHRPWTSTAIEEAPWSSLFVCAALRAVLSSTWRVS